MIDFIIAGFIVGFAVGATGVGGGSLMTPLLILYFGISPAVAVGTDLLYAFLTKAFGVVLHRQQQTVDWRVVGTLAVGSVPASLITVGLLSGFSAEEIPDALITTTLAIAILLTAVGVMFKSRLANNGLEKRFGIVRRLRDPRRRPAVTILLGIALGVLVTLSSVGAGVIGVVILMVLYPHMRPISVVGTDIAHAVVLTAVAGLGHTQLGTTDFTILAYLLMGSLPGIFLGTRIGLNLPDHVLRTTIAGMLMAIGVSLLV